MPAGITIKATNSINLAGSLIITRAPWRFGTTPPCIGGSNLPALREAPGSGNTLWFKRVLRGELPTGGCGAGRGSSMDTSGGGGVSLIAGTDFAFSGEINVSPDPARGQGDAPAPGGGAGGLVSIIAGVSISGNGTIVANGSDGGDGTDVGGAGGGGAGGVVLLAAPSIDDAQWTFNLSGGAPGAPGTGTSVGGGGGAYATNGGNGATPDSTAGSGTDGVIKRIIVNNVKSLF